MFALGAILAASALQAGESAAQPQLGKYPHIAAELLAMAERDQKRASD